MPASEAIQADTSPLSEIDVNGEIGFMERHVALLDILSPSLFVGWWRSFTVSVGKTFRIEPVEGTDC